MTATLAPDYVYRLACIAEWRAAQQTGVIPLRDIDERDGYMHLSARDQVLETARLHFAGADDLLALEIPLAPIAGKVKFELAPKRGEVFPHLYAPLHADQVRKAISLRRSGADFTFGSPL